MSEPGYDRILDAAERLFGRLGYGKMTMDDVAREASLSKRTIYLHFRSKEDVTLSTIDRIVDRLLGRVREVAASGGSPADRIGRMLVLRVMFRVDSVRDYYRSLDDLLGSIRPAYLLRRDRYFADEAAVFAGVLAEGVADGSLAATDPTATAGLLLLATNALLPSGLGARGLAERSAVEAQALGVAGLLLDGLQRRDPPG